MDFHIKTIPISLLYVCDLHVKLWATIQWAYV